MYHASSSVVLINFRCHVGSSFDIAEVRYYSLGIRSSVTGSPVTWPRGSGGLAIARIKIHRIPKPTKFQRPSRNPIESDDIWPRRDFAAKKGPRGRAAYPKFKKDKESVETIQGIPLKLAYIKASFNESFELVFCKRLFKAPLRDC